MYAIVPAIRYTEHGMRMIDASIRRREHKAAQETNDFQCSITAGLTGDYARFKPDNHFFISDACNSSTY